LFKVNIIKIDIATDAILFYYEYYLRFLKMGWLVKI